ncbi:MAG: hypothetical protein P0S93_05910 [Candidatus Neptunochlamydia sp.]|nr:hypothetical protein [Candidatus Neptunochlamydia sp.]
MYAYLKADHHENIFPIEEESLTRVIQEELKKIPEESSARETKRAERSCY